MNCQPFMALYIFLWPSNYTGNFLHIQTPRYLVHCVHFTWPLNFRLRYILFYIYISVIHCLLRNSPVIAFKSQATLQEGFFRSRHVFQEMDGWLHCVHLTRPMSSRVFRIVSLLWHFIAFYGQATKQEIVFITRHPGI